MNQQMTSTLAQGDQTQVVLIGKDGQAVITSVELTQLINQFRVEEGNTTELQHKTLLESIRTEIKTLENAGIGQQNFLPTFYSDAQNKKRPCFEMNKAGVLQMLNKESAVVRYKTVQYIEKLEKKNKNKPLSTMAELRLHYKVLEEQQEELSEIKIEVTDLKENMPLFNIECKELQSLVRSKGIDVLGGYQSNAYKDNSLRGKVYSDIQRQLKREFGVSRYEAIKRKQFELATRIVGEYKGPLVLIEEIKLKNQQTSLFDKE